MERTRNIQMDPAHGGTPCGDTEDEEACGTGSCDADCILSDWSQWSTCSKKCDGGSFRRTNQIVLPARGNGECWEAEHEKRLQFLPCNDFDCKMLLPENRSVLQCQSKVDLIILLDGSGSLGEYGWKQSQEMAAKLIGSLEGGSDFVKVSLEVFSGPKTWDDYEKCTDELPAGETLDLKEQCGIQWVSHYTTDMNTLAEEVLQLPFPAATTLTSVAIGQAEAELINGREDANAVVVVITDGKPMNQVSTKDAARQLQEKARMVWVPVGGGAPAELIQEVASKPIKDHIISIATFQQMDQPEFLNKILSTTCPIVG